MDLKKNAAGMWIDEHGRFVSPKIAEAIMQKKEELARLEQEAESIVASENEAPEWLKKTIVAIADAFGITAQEFAERVKVIHPTPVDPVILVDGKPVISWI